MAFSLIASYLQDRKKEVFFHVLLIFIELGQELTHFAHKENTQSKNFSVRQAKNFNCILFSEGSDIRCHLTWLKY
jgi:hypothetical protein